MGTKRKLFTEQVWYGESELKAKIQELVDSNEESMVELVTTVFGAPDAWDHLLEWMVKIIGRKVMVAAEAYNIVKALTTWCQIIETAIEQDKLASYMKDVEAGGTLIIYTDVYEWTAGSGNSVAYITEHRYVVR